MAASDSWPLIEVGPSAGSRLGPRSDPLGAPRRAHESFSLGRSVARTEGLRPEQRSDVSALRASLHEGGGPPLKGGLRPEPLSVAIHDPLRRGVGCLGRFGSCRGRGPRSLARRSLRPALSSGQEQCAEMLGDEIPYTSGRYWRREDGVV